MKDLLSKRAKRLNKFKDFNRQPQNLICSSLHNCHWYNCKTLCCKPEIIEAAFSSLLLFNTSEKATRLLSGKYSTSCENINSKRCISCFILWLFSWGNTSLRLLPFKFKVWNKAQILTQGLEKSYHMHILTSCLPILSSLEATFQVFPTLCYAWWGKKHIQRERCEAAVLAWIQLYRYLKYLLCIWEMGCFSASYPHGSTATVSGVSPSFQRLLEKH